MTKHTIDTACQSQPGTPEQEAAYAAEQREEADAFLAGQAESVLFAERPGSRLEERPESGFIVSGKYASAEIYTSPSSSLPGADHDWITIVTDDTDGCAMLDIECLDDLITALVRIRDARNSR